VFVDNVSGLDNKTTEFVIPNTYFYAKIINETDDAYSEFAVNLGSTHEIRNDIDEFYDNYTHGLGYYTVVNNRSARGYYNFSSITWEDYYDYLSHTDNQALTFVEGAKGSFKMKQEKGSRSFNGDKDYPNRSLK